MTERDFRPQKPSKTSRHNTVSYWFTLGSSRRKRAQTRADEENDKLPCWKEMESCMRYSEDISEYRRGNINTKNKEETSRHDLPLE